MSVFTKGRRIMRITAEEKAATRNRIVSAAKQLFRAKGFHAATTRDIAKEAGIAVGTMFNYFQSKEAIVVELAIELLDKAKTEFEKNRRTNVELAEELFASIAIQLRAMRSIRKYIRPVLDTALTTAGNDVATELRKGLVEHFDGILAAHGFHDPSTIQQNILWSLYVGVLTHWGNDKSPKQEDSLALLDQSIRMYADWLKQ